MLVTSSLIFVGDTKIIFGYNFVAPLILIVSNWYNFSGLGIKIFVHFFIDNILNLPVSPIITGLFKYV